MKFRLTNLIVLLVGTTTSVNGFGTALFPVSPSAQQQTFPTKDQREEIELPNFDELFGRIKQVSPLARITLDDHEDRSLGFAGIPKSDDSPNLKWKRVEAHKNRLVHEIEKIDNFQGLNAPLLRFRSSLQGPCDGEAFANFIMNLEDRKKWDAQIDNVYEAYTIDDLDMANMAMGFNYGDCSKMGVGHCITKANLGIDAREQLTICGINDFEDGSCIIWGTEMEDRHNYLFPPGPRSTRARSHLFCTTLVPTGPFSFDVEYVIQLEIGGKIPTWMTTPIVIDNVKKMFSVAQKFFNNDGGELEKFLEEKAKRNELTSGISFLMTPSARIIHQCMMEQDPWEEKVAFVRRYYENKGYRVHSGLQFGCELVLYADDPQRVHSDFCIHVVRDDDLLDWRSLQTLVRSMPDLHKTLILASVEGDYKAGSAEIHELAMATEHAPFRHRQKLAEVGGQKKIVPTNQL